MKKHCTREQVRELDRRAIEEYHIPGVVLRENAGRGAAEGAADMLVHPAGKKVLLLCGKGNNGGDGYVVARHLRNRGARVQVVLGHSIEDNDEISDAGINFRIIRAMDVPVRQAVSEDEQRGAALLAKEADLIVDALLGTGLSGEVREPYLSLIRLINAADKPVLSIDLPSGLDANTGAVLRCAVRATATATFVLPKVGFEFGQGPELVGEVTVVDIGVPKELIEEIR